MYRKFLTVELLALLIFCTNEQDQHHSRRGAGKEGDPGYMGLEVGSGLFSQEILQVVLPTSAINLFSSRVMFQCLSERLVTSWHWAALDMEMALN